MHTRYKSLPFLRLSCENGFVDMRAAADEPWAVAFADHLAAAGAVVSVDVESRGTCWIVLGLRTDAVCAIGSTTPEPS